MCVAKKKGSLTRQTVGYLIAMDLPMMLQQSLANPDLLTARLPTETKAIAKATIKILNEYKKTNAPAIEVTNSATSLAKADAMAQRVLGGASAHDAQAILEKMLIAQGVDASIIAVLKSKLESGVINPSQVYALFRKFRGMNILGVIELLQAVPVDQLANISNHADFGVIMSMWNQYKQKGRLDIKDVLLHLLELKDMKDPSPPASPTSSSPASTLRSTLKSFRGLYSQDSDSGYSSDSDA